MLGPLAVPFALAGLALVTVVIVIRALLSQRVVARPNEALLITGGRRGVRVVLHGGAFVQPLLERVDIVPLGLIPADAGSRGITSDGTPISVQAHVEVKVDSTEAMVIAASEVLLGKSATEAQDITTRIVLGHLQGLVVRFSCAQVEHDPESLAAAGRERCAPDLMKLGLRLVTLSVTCVHADRLQAIREFKAKKPWVFGAALAALVGERVTPSTAESPAPSSGGIPARAFGHALAGIADAAPDLAEPIAKLTAGLEDRLDVSFDELDRWVDALLEGASRGDPDRERALKGLPVDRIQAAVCEAVQRMAPGEREPLGQVIRELAAAVGGSAPLALDGACRALTESASVRHSLLAATHERLGIPRPLRRGEAFDGRFEVIELLGIGGMGEVYRVRDRRRDKEVALKILTRALLDDPAARTRFGREVNLAMELTHPNIVRVHDVGDAAGRPYLHMELVEGTTLRARLAKGACPLPEALSIARGFLSGLAHAHQRGVLHLDVKPENILLARSGEVKLADLGLARGIGLDGMRSLLTGAGTPHYMAPEQMKTGEEIDARADVFAAGVVLYEMLAGEPPIGAFEPLPESIPERLRAAVQRCLSPRRDRRPADAGELLGEIA